MMNLEINNYNINTKGEWINFGLKRKYLDNFNIQVAATELIKIVKQFGAESVLVMEDGYAFLWNNGEFSDGDARELGRRVASIPAYKNYVTRYPYRYRSTGKPGKSGQLFIRLK